MLPLVQSAALGTPVEQCPTGDVEIVVVVVVREQDSADATDLGRGRR